MPELPTPPPIDPAVSPERRKRRLLPDLSDEIEVGGQRLTRVLREAPGARDAPEKLTMEDIARKHLGPAEARVIEENADLLRALQEVDAAPAEPSHAEEIASRMELFTDGAAVVPHPEPDAQKRPETMTVSPLVGLEGEGDFLGGRKSPETIFDLFSLFPQLDGVNWYIYVERKDPKLFMGRKVGGILRPIPRAITLSEWQYWYGGGTYKLIVYGPSKRAVSLNADGRAPARALTEAVTVIFPGVPSFASEVYDGDDEMTQAAPTGFPNIPNGGVRRGPASTADASIEKAKLEGEFAREIRHESKADEERKRADRVLQDKARSEGDLLSKFLELQAQSQAREAELRDRQVEREREVAEERRAEDAKWEERIARLIGEKKQPDDLDRLAKLSGIISKPDNSESLRQQHSLEMERVQSSAKDAADRAAERVKEAEARADRRIEEERARSAERIREVETRYATQERDLRAHADREVARAKEDSERRISDMHRIHTDAMANESRNHERDMKSRESQSQMALESLKNTYEMRLETAKSEVKRTGNEVDRWKKEAEDGRDVVGKMQKIREQASELGMVPAEEANAPAEPETVPQMLMKMAGGVVQHLPGIVESVGGVFKSRSEQQMQQARLAGRAEMEERAGQFGLPSSPERALPQSPSRRRHGPPQLGGAGYVPRHMSEVSASPIHHGGDPFTVPPPIHFQSVESATVEAVAPDAYLQQQVLQQAPPPMAQAMQPPQPAQAMQPLASVFPQAAPPPAPLIIGPPPSVAPGPATMPPPPPSPETEVALAEDQQILQAELMVRPHYQAGAPAPLLADQMLGQLGTEMITNMVTMIDAERVFVAIQRSGDPNSPFLRRAGKTYLRQLFEELKKRLA